MSKIPSYYNNFKKNEKPEDMVSWKAWLAASAAALFGMSASAEGANYAGELKPVVRRQQFEIAAVPQQTCLLYTSPSPRDRTRSRMPSSA